MLGFAVRRLLEAVPTLLLVTLVVFGLMHVGPGDPVASMLGSQHLFLQRVTSNARFRYASNATSPLLSGSKRA